MLQDYNIDNVNILGDAIDFSINMDARHSQREDVLDKLRNPDHGHDAYFGIAPDLGKGKKG